MNKKGCNNLFPLIALLFTLLGCLSFSSCASITRIIDKNDSGLLLEVNTEAGNSSYPRGKILDFKLYNNKKVEFDFYAPNTPDRVGMPYSSERKYSTIIQEEFNEIKSLLSNSDALNAQDYYAPSIRSIDSHVKKTVTFKVENQEKTIVLEERDSHLHLEDKTNIYPPSIIRLLNLVEDINLRLRKQIDSESR